MIDSPYSEKKAFELYVYYLSLKQHFTSEYDYFKYNGKVSARYDTFQKRKDRFFFYKLSNRDESKELIFANILENPSIWIGDLVDTKAKDVYNQWKKRLNSLTYRFKEELSYIDDLKASIRIENGQHPQLLTFHIQNKVSIETLTILDMIIKFFSYWRKNIDDGILFPDINKKVDKYKPFLERSIELTKFKKILLNKYNTTHTTHT